MYVTDVKQHKIHREMLWLYTYCVRVYYKKVKVSLVGYIEQCAKHRLVSAMLSPCSKPKSWPAYIEPVLQKGRSQYLSYKIQTGEQRFETRTAEIHNMSL